MATNTFTLIHLIDLKCVTQWEVIVAELVEWLLPTPEDTESSHRQLYFHICLLLN